MDDADDILRLARALKNLQGQTLQLANLIAELTLRVRTIENYIERGEKGDGNAGAT